MARFQVLEAFHFGDKRVRAGKTIADSNANAQAGDAVWTGMNSNNIREFFIPLDASATTMKSASKYANAPAATSITGVMSVD
jgi:hypothetical protein